MNELQADQRTERDKSPAIKTFKDELKRSHASLKLATEAAGLGIWTWFVETGVLDWNQKMFTIYETPEDVIESGLLYEYWEQSLHQEDKDRATQSLLNAVEKNLRWEEEFRIQFPDGRIKYIKASAVSIIDETTSHKTVIGANLDVTVEKTLQLELEDKTKIAEQHSLAKSQFLANMSHEIRTPMNVILGIGDLLESTKLSSKQTEYVNLIMRSAHKLLDLLNDILDLSKIEAGELRTELLCFPLEEVIVDSLKTLSTRAHEKGLDYHFKMSSNVPKWVESDPVRLGQILINLVSNAIKFTKHGEINVKVESYKRITDEEKTNYIKIDVSDTGIGIADSKLETIFAPFNQADQSTTRKYGGTGLGLSIVAQLVKLLGGTIDISSQLMKGTTISVTLPIKLGEPDEVAIDTSEDFDYFIEFSASALKSLNCLVIESHAVNRQWLNEMLQSWHCNVTSYEFPKEGIGAIIEAKTAGRMFDLAIINNQFSEIDGFELANQIKRECEKYQIDAPKILIMLASHRLADDIEKCESHNIQSYIIKPVKQSEVFNAIMTAVGKKATHLHTGEPIVKIAHEKALNILVAEDHELNQFLVREILENRGHKVTLVENGRLALNAVNEGQFDLVLMDVQMPVMDGITATREIRKSSRNPTISIIGLTARALKEDAQICLDSGMDYYLTKPLVATELLEVIESRKKIYNENESTKPSIVCNDTAEPEIINFTVFDKLRGLKTTAQDSVLLNKLLKLAVENLGPSLNDLDELFRKEDWIELGKKVHQVKGMLSNFCTAILVEKLDSLIQLTENKETDAIAPAFTDAREQIAICKRELTAYLKQIKTGID